MSQLYFLPIMLCQLPGFLQKAEGFESWHFNKNGLSRTLATASEVWEPKFWPTPSLTKLGHLSVRLAPSRTCLASTWSWRAGTLQMYQHLMVQMPLWQPPQCQPPSPIQRPQVPLIPIRPPPMPQLWQDDVSLIFHGCRLFYVAWFHAVFNRVPFGSLPAQ